MFRQAVSRVILALIFVISGYAVSAAPYAAFVIDARTGEVLHSVNADTRLHPASLTKMMTLYVTFEAIRNGEISLETIVTVSSRAAGEQPSKLGLKAGQKIALYNLIRAAAVKSANDAATAIAEAVSGSEAAFARRMNKTAKALGMNRTTFRNAHGLTEEGHLSTARDMTILGRHLFFDFPQYYNLFSRRETRAGGKNVRNTNRKFLDAYDGADGIKTGYTQAAGFNLVASARRGEKRVIATVFGGRSTATRNAKVAELLDLGFRKAPKHAAVRPPDPPAYAGAPGAKRIVVAAVATSPRPQPRVARTPEETEKLMAAIGDAVAEANAETADQGDASEDQSDTAASIRPEPRDDGLRVVTRVSTSGGQHWGINLGSFANRTEAEKLLLRTALQDLSALDGALRKVVVANGKYQASFVGLSEELAARACSRLKARRQDCRMVGPGG
ncbi:MAG: D-alanyl-D-alanine carboxypeptidase [Rhodobacteraceae bacterium]|nr:D-alanyl-D-alanine carboxypeptidase [Paracoccaceae bacterium]